jgi:UMP-CMP kinase family protein
VNSLIYTALDIMRMRHGIVISGSRLFLMTCAVHSQEQGKCAEISATDTPDAVFTNVIAALSDKLPDLAVLEALASDAPVDTPVVVESDPTPDTAEAVELVENSAHVEPAELEQEALPDQEEAVVADLASDVAADVANDGNADDPGPASVLPEDSRVIFVLGGPGSGKGTQCERIVDRYAGVHHFSAGDLLRDAVKSGNTELEVIMREGKLVPMDVTIGLLRDAMVATGGTRFLIDGFPRAMDQAEAFESTIQPCTAVLYFECSEEVMRARLLERGKTSGRADDNEETIVKRFRTFVEQSKPVIEHFKSQDKVFEILSERSPDDVFAEVQQALDGVLTTSLAAVASI